MSFSKTPGYTLTEVILAMAVVSVSLPLILGLVVAGGESSRRAERETRAVLSARSVFEEVRRAINNNSEFINESDLPWRGGNAVNIGALSGGSFGSAASGESEGDDEWLLLELDKNGAIIGHADEMEYEDAWEGTDVKVAALAAVRGFFQEVENVEITDGVPLNVFRVEVRIESPAQAESDVREQVVFIQSNSLR